MKLLLKRVRQAGASSSRGALFIIFFCICIIFSALFGARNPAPQKAGTTVISKPLVAAPTPVSAVLCASPNWTKLSPTGTAPDINSQQFVSDGKGNLIMFGGCGPTACNGSTNTFVLRDAFGVAGSTHWVQLADRWAAGRAACPSPRL